MLLFLRGIRNLLPLNKHHRVLAIRAIIQEIVQTSEDQANIYMKQESHTISELGILETSEPSVFSCGQDCLLALLSSQLGIIGSVRVFGAAGHLALSEGRMIPAYQKEHKPHCRARGRTQKEVSAQHSRGLGFNPP